MEIFFREVTPILQRLRDANYEIVCVDDGSTDSTLIQLRAACESDPCIRVIALSRNFGKEAALTAGIDEAAGTAVIPFDADLQDPPEVIPLLLAKWREGFDVVLARRIDRRSDSMAKRGSAALFYRLHNAISDIRVPENAGDFRLMSRQVVDALKQLPENRRFMKGLFAWVGFRTAELAYARRPRTAGQSCFTGWRLWNLALEGVTSFSTLPLRIWSYLGGATALFAMLYAAYLLLRTIVHGIDVPGYASLIIAVLFLGGLQLVGIGVIGEYIGRIYMESKRRPIYIVRDIYRHDPTVAKTPSASPPQPKTVAISPPVCASSVPHTVSLLRLLGVHALVWTIAAWLSRGNLDVPGDMVENYIWGIEWQAGYAKHPPFFAWVTAAWFRVFPHGDIAYFALSALNAMVGLLGIAALAGRFLPRHLAVIAALAMAVSPLYSNLAIKFNANAVLLSLWPWTAYCFVRFMQGGGWRSAIALGALAGAAVLGKYFSAVLLLALLLVALARPVWRARLLQPVSLWIVAAGLVVLLPHIHWLVVNDFPTLGYMEHRTGGTMAAAGRRLLTYTLAQSAYLLPSTVLLLWLVREKRLVAAKQIVGSIIKPSVSADLWWLAFSPLIVVAGLAIIAKTEMAAVWGMAQWFAIVPLWLVAIDRGGVVFKLERAPRVMLFYWVVVLAVSAMVGYNGAKRGGEGATAPRAELALAAETLWQEQTGKTLPIVAGSVQDAGSIAFYGDSEKTQYWNPATPSDTPWLTMADLRARGALFVCRSEDSVCIARAQSLTHVAPRAITVSKHAWGKEAAPRSYELFVMPANQ